MLSLFCTLLVVLSVQQQCSAQSAFNNIRFKSIAITGDTLKLDSLSLVPNTLVLKAPDGTVIDSSTYTIKAFIGAWAKLDFFHVNLLLLHLGFVS